MRIWNLERLFINIRVRMYFFIVKQRELMKLNNSENEVWNNGVDLLMFMLSHIVPWAVLPSYVYLNLKPIMEPIRQK